MSKVITASKHTCQSCGRTLGIGFYYSCHICGATYCYIHFSRHDRAHSRLTLGSKRTAVPLITTTTTTSGDAMD